MFKMSSIEDSGEPPSSGAPVTQKNGNGANGDGTATNRESDKGLFGFVKSVLKGKSEPTLREAIEEFMEEAHENGHSTLVSIQEHTLINNILELRDMTVVDVMIPRADIAAIDIGTSQKDLLALLSERQFSRFPVYRETLDNVIGTIHIKDIIACLARNRPVEIADLVREVPIISPAMHVLDLILMMRQMRKHMALVVDEYGGIDGMVTIGDVIEAIIGEIEDEYEQESHSEMIPQADGSLIADARVDLEEFEEEYGNMFSEDEREDADTLGGLVSAIAGRVPVRGEVLTHSTGMVFEVLEADPRRVGRLRIKNIPNLKQEQ